MKIKKIVPTNPVAKHSRNKSGAGAHKSAKDYSRKLKHKNDESIANKIDRLILLEMMQESCFSATNWFNYEEQIQKLKEELDDWQTTE